MPPVSVELTTKQPASPKADFAFYIDFKRGEGPASRIFSATHDFITACEKFDRELVSSIDSHIETVMVLEDIEVASLKTWLRNALSATDDQALKDLDWKPQVGKYLVRAKYMVLRWIDDENSPRDLPALGREIQKLAAETDVRHLPDYKPVDPQAILTAIADFQHVKDRLSLGDRASVITLEGEHEMNLTMRWNIEDIEALAVKEVQEIKAPSMILVVKKPDYLGTSKWEMRLGKKPILAKIGHDEWLKEFQDRRIDVRPGDALKCEVMIEHHYGYDNELLSERYVINKVHEVLVNAYSQADLFDEKK